MILYEKFKLPYYVMAELPVTDLKSVIKEINKYRYFKALSEHYKRKASYYRAEYRKNKKNGKKKEG